jgi:hypothetical protein
MVYDYKKINVLRLCTIKYPTSLAFIGSKGNSYHAIEKCEGVNIKGVKSISKTYFS